MRKPDAIISLALSLSLVLVPFFVLDVHAFGCAPTCNLQAITKVPLAEHLVRVKVDGATTYTLNQTWAFSNSTVHTIQVLDTVFTGAQSGMRYTFKQWTYVGTGQQWDSSPTMTTPPMYGNYTTAQCSGTVNCPFRADFTVSPALGCNSNCRLQALTTVPSADGNIMVKVDGSTVYTLSQTFSFLNGTVHTIQVLNSSFTGASSGARYVWKQWSCACGVAASPGMTLTTPTMYYNYTSTSAPPENGVGSFTAEFVKAFPLTLSFTDPSGNPIGSPNNVTLTSSVSSTVLTSFAGQYLSTTAWSVADVTWEGVAGLQVSSQTFDLTNGPVAQSVPVKAFSATVKTVDSGGKPVSNATVTVTLANSTVRSFTTDNQGLANIGYIPKGTYSAAVAYRGSSVGTWSTDASSNPVLVVTVPIQGGIPAPTTVVSALVLLTILGTIFFLIVLAVRTHKPATPPDIAQDFSNFSPVTSTKSTASMGQPDARPGSGVLPD